MTKVKETSPSEVSAATSDDADQLMKLSRQWRASAVLL